MRHICRLFAAVLLVALVAACGGTKTVTTSPTVIVVTPTPVPASVTATSAASATAAGETGSQDHPVPAGQALLLPTGWELSLLDVIEDATTYQGSMGLEHFRQPSEGHRNLVVQGRIKNVSAGNPARFPYGYSTISLVGQSLVLYGMAWPGPPPAMGGAVLEGGTLEGDIPFSEVPESEAELMLVVQDGQDTFFFALE